MSRWIAVAATFVLSLWSFASQAITLEPLPGSTPQTTCFSCVFPNPIGVIARGTAGEPLAGVTVTFTTQSSTLGMVRFDDFCCVAFDQSVAVTGANGVAVGTVLTISVPGTSGVVTASASGATDVAFQLSSSTQRATNVVIVGGHDQTAQTGTLFASPWQARALDAANQPVPNTMITFYAGGFDSADSTANFNGDDWAFAVADANGIANSPVARAGRIGSDSGLVEARVKTSVDGEAISSAFFAFYVVPYAISQVTLEPLPGSTPQTTCFSCVFPNPIGVIARGASGEPLAGVAVTFTTRSLFLGMVRFDDFCCVAFEQTTAVTGADGKAFGTVITHYLPGESGVVTASAVGAAEVAFQLSSSTKRATTVAIVGGDEQYAQTGTLFAAPWKVRVLDAAGQPMPNAMVTFYAGGFDGSASSASFNGNDWAFAVADANGVASSPPARAGAIVGDYGVVDAATKAPVDGEAVPSVLFLFHVVPYPITASRATLVGAPPTSLQWNTLAATPYVVRVVDASGQPASGQPVVFTAESCGSFGGLYEGFPQQVVLSDAQGLARAGPLLGAELGVCNIHFRAAGIPEGITASMHVFDPNAVVVTPRSPWVVAKKKQIYRVVVDFTESGRPIQPASLEAVNVLRDRRLPPAGFVPPPTISIVNGSATLDLRANQVPGLYDLEIVFWGPSRARVHVIQVP